MGGYQPDGVGSLLGAAIGGAAGVAVGGETEVMAGALLGGTAAEFLSRRYAVQDELYTAAHSYGRNVAEMFFE